MTVIVLFLILLAGPAWAGDSALTSTTVQPALAELVARAEDAIYAFGEPEHLNRLNDILNQIEKVDPRLPYLYWARARLAFFRKEEFYVLEQGNVSKTYETQKLDLADECHRNADQCSKLAPRMAECWMMKGACFAMQASTWGVTFKTLRVLQPMDWAWKKAMEYPSDFAHREGVTTKQLSQILRGILYRVMPDSFWLKLLAGIRGDREQSYEWIREAVVPSLRKDPLIMIELGAAALCYGQEEEKPEKIEEGLATLREGLRITPRDGADRRDLENMRHMLDQPNEACHYRRERFEKVEETGLK